MTRVRFYGALSLDGFLAGPDDNIDWLEALGMPEINTYDDFIADVGAICMGSATYDWVMQQVGPDGWPYSQPAFVFSSRERVAPDGLDIRFVSGDVAAVHAQMVQAAAGKDLWVVGGGALVAQFHTAGLLDELIVQTAAVAIGNGKPFWVDALQGAALAVTSVQQLAPGFVETRYHVVT